MNRLAFRIRRHIAEHCGLYDFPQILPLWGLVTTKTLL